MSDNDNKPPVVFTAIPGGKLGPDAGAQVLKLHAKSAVRMQDVVGMAELKRTIRLRIVEPFQNPGLFARFRKKVGGGVMLYGPPGCGKTMIAKAVANECGATFVGVTLSDILDPFVGVSESNITEVFARARAHKPAVLFFDELDALAYARSKAGSSNARTRVNALLHELDGVDTQNDSVLVLAATNMPWDVDDAAKRPGRFDRLLFVPPPDVEARTQMMRNRLEGVPHAGVNVEAIAEATKFFSGADLDGLIETAKEFALDEIVSSGTERPLCQSDFQTALKDMEPSTMEWLRTAKNLVKYGGASRAYRDVADYLDREGL